MAFVQAPASYARPLHLVKRHCRSAANAQAQDAFASRKPLHFLFLRTPSRNKHPGGTASRVPTAFQYPGFLQPTCAQRSLTSSPARRVFSGQESQRSHSNNETERQTGWRIGRYPKRKHTRADKLAALSLTETTLFEEPLPETLPELAMQADDMSPYKTPNAEFETEATSRNAKAATPDDPKKAEKWVPRRLGEAAVHFVKQPSVVLSLAAIVAVAAARCQFRWTLADGPVVVIMAAWWAFFEWFLHAKLLHSQVNWFGRGIHKRHHEAPFHHVSIDGMDLVGVSLVGFAAFCVALFGKSPLALTGTLTVYCMGLLYEWTHYLVHTKVPMRSYIGSLIKRAHVSHHLKDQRYWLSFTCPAIDVIMGTTPEGGQGVTPVT